jgi:hypothetical protein
MTGLDEEARARLLALKATELIHLMIGGAAETPTGARGEKGTTGTPPVTAESNVPAASSASPPSPPPEKPTVPTNQAATIDEAKKKPPASTVGPLVVGSTHSLSIGALGLLAGKPLAFLAGPSLADALGLGPRFALAADVAGNLGAVEREGKQLRLRGVGASMALLASHDGARLQWGVGLGGRIGWMQLRGEPISDPQVEGKTASGIWGGPMAVGQIAYALPISRMIVGMGVEAGLITLPLAGLIDSQQPPFFALSGPWLGAHVSLGFEFAKTKVRASPE